jgi:pre-mRNA cleavage complex 2 protein Pcf11
MLANLLPTTDVKVPRNNEKAYAVEGREEERVERVERNREEPSSSASSQADPLNVQDLLNKLMSAGLLPTAGLPSNSTSKDTKEKEGESSQEAEKKEAAPDTNSKPEEEKEKKESPKPKAETPLPPPPEVVDVTFKDNLKERRPKLVDTLYVGVQCGSCGLRFGPDQTFR